jgi:hypothetical protein
MLKTRIITAIIALAMSGVSVTALALSSSGTQEVFSTPPVIEPPSPSPYENPAYVDSGFWVCEFDGYAAVFHSADRSSPIEKTDIALRSLRMGDQELFRTGLFFEDYMDVVIFLEDFGP